MMLGSVIYSYVVKSGPAPTSDEGSAQEQHQQSMITSHASVASCTFLVACLSLGLSAYLTQVQLRFWAFCVFEGTVGVYFPTMGWLKSELISDDVRANVRLLQNSSYGHRLIDRV